MDVSYSLSRDDFESFARYMQSRVPVPRPRSAVRRIGFFVIPVLVVAVPLEGYARENLTHLAVTVAVALIAALVIGVPGYWLDGRRGRVKAMTLPSDLTPLLGNHRTTISKDGLRDRCPKYDVTVPWRELTDITEDEEYIYLVMGRKSSGFFVPKRDFPSTARAKAFIDEARDLWEQNRLAKPARAKAGR